MRRFLPQRYFKNIFSLKNIFLRKYSIKPYEVLAVFHQKPRRSDFFKPNPPLLQVPIFKF